MHLVVRQMSQVNFFNPEEHLSQVFPAQQNFRISLTSHQIWTLHVSPFSRCNSSKLTIFLSLQCCQYRYCDKRKVGLRLPEKQLIYNSGAVLRNVS